MMDYAIVISAIASGVLLLILVAYLIYRRSIAISVATSIAGSASVTALMGFMVGREGITIGRVTIAVVVSVIIAAVWLSVLVKQIVSPARQMVMTAIAIARGDVDQQVDVTRHDELGDLANAFRDMIAYLREMAGAADLLARGDLTADVTPRSEKDMLGNAFSRMIAYQQEMANAADRLAQGDLAADVMPRSEKDRLGNAFSQMITSLKKVIQDIVGVSQRLAEGDLRVMPKAEYRGDLMRIKNALETALSGLNDTMSQTNAVVEQVAPSVEQIRAISQSLASGAEEQSSAAEEVASSLEETDAQVRNNAESANVANQLASQTSNVANVGQEKMKTMTRAMDAIATSSQQISKIIKVIDEIAFQTNLLALNAAVEAARAGQHGRGFAVVAQEVRNLAGRSAKAAKETAELIEDAGRRVGEGVGIAGETEAALGEIVQNVLKVKDLVSEIAAASEDQARGVAQVNTAMVQVNQGAQAASQQSEELASTADELGNLTEMLREQTARFKLREQREPVLAGMTPEVLQRIAELVRSQGAASGGPAASKPQATKRGDAGLELPLDRDERGYGEF